MHTRGGCVGACVRVQAACAITLARVRAADVLFALARAARRGVVGHTAPAAVALPWDAWFECVRARARASCRHAGPVRYPARRRSLSSARSDVALSLHHDAITGTARAHVAAGTLRAPALSASAVYLPRASITCSLPRLHCAAVEGTGAGRPCCEVVGCGAAGAPGAGGQPASADSKLDGADDGGPRHS